MSPGGASLPGLWALQAQPRLHQDERPFPAPNSQTPRAEVRPTCAADNCAGSRAAHGLGRTRSGNEKRQMARGQAGRATRAGGRRRLRVASSARIGRRHGKNRLGPGEGPPGSQRSHRPPGSPPPSGCPPPRRDPCHGDSTLAPPPASGSVSTGTQLSPSGSVPPHSRPGSGIVTRPRRAFIARGAGGTAARRSGRRRPAGEWAGARLHQHVAGRAVGGRTDRQNHGQKDRWLGGELGGELNGRPARGQTDA